MDKKEYDVWAKKYGPRLGKLLDDIYQWVLDNPEEADGIAQVSREIRADLEAELGIEFPRFFTDRKKAKPEKEPFPPTPRPGRKRIKSDEDVRRALKLLTIELGRRPTLDELRQELGVGSIRTVQRYLKRIEKC